MRIGIFGGTFNPIHNGHLFIAENTQHIFNMDKIIFMPTGDSPHKSNEIDKEHRYNMVTKATAGNHFFDVSRFELDKPAKSYTIDTIHYVNAKYPDDDIFFIIGADSFMNIQKWKNVDEILTLAKLIVVSRPNVTDISKQLQTIRVRHSNCKIYVLDVPALNISSTEIRNRCMINYPISHLTNVHSYIKEHELYCGCDMLDKLRDKLSLHRFIHSIGCAHEAVKLAENYNADAFKAYVAGILHDCAKELPQKHDVCIKLGIELDDVLRQQIDLSHQFIGAEIAHIEFGIDDCDILNAIRYHTTGRANMTLLEKIIYVADIIEPNRSFNDIAYVRELAYTDIDSAIAYILRFVIDKNQKLNRGIHKLSIDALNFFSSKMHKR